MTEKRLMQYRGLVKEIEQFNADIAELEKEGPKEVTDAVTSAAEFPFSKHTVMIKGLAITEYNAKLNRLKEKKSRAEQEVKELDDYIDNVPDANLRTAMRYRFIEDKGWRWISWKVYDRLDESYSRRKVHKFLKMADFADFTNV